jgi:hypothetical protein
LTAELTVIPPARTLATASGFVLPAVIADAGDRAAKRFVEFFTATIRNRHTRKAYARAAGDFFAWCEASALTLLAIEPLTDCMHSLDGWLAVGKGDYLRLSARDGEGECRGRTGDVGGSGSDRFLGFFGAAPPAGGSMCAVRRPASRPLRSGRAGRRARRGTDRVVQGP